MNGIVIVPTYNEAANLEPLVRQILEPAGRAGRAGRGRQLPGRHRRPGRPTVAATGRPRAGGSTSCTGRARRAWAGRIWPGFAWALERGYDFLIEMDADFSHDPIFSAGSGAARTRPTSCSAPVISTASPSSIGPCGAFCFPGARTSTCGCDGPARPRLHERLPAVPARGAGTRWTWAASSPTATRSRSR